MAAVDTEANRLLTSLTAGSEFDIPKVDLSGDQFKFPGGLSSPLYSEVTPVTIEALTTRLVDGSGAFDALMSTFSAHLKSQYDNNRITGAAYAQTYADLSQSALQGAVSFLLGKDQAFWQAQTAQVQAISALIELESAKVKLAAVQLEAQNQEAQYALTKIQLANQEAAYDTAQYNLNSMLPQQLALLTTQKAGEELKNQSAQYQLTNILPQQLLNLKTQDKLTTEQIEVQRAQTLDTRTDGALVSGTVSRQKKLYEQQVISYQRDAEVKMAKLFTDAWITQKTMDEGLVAPAGFQNASIDNILSILKVKNQF
uniref:Tail protein n=1 Tax=Pseudomonas phage Arace01 TaxID=3138526 RepID=A0AAU6W0V2_9VIRU